MADELPIQVALDAITSEEAISAGVAALERIHGHHLAELSPEEQVDARNHWRRQVEETLAAVYGLYGAPPPPHTGRAVLWFTDAADGRVHISATFQPQLRQLADDQVSGTPAQIRALIAYEAAREEPPGEAQPAERDDRSAG